MVGSKRIPWYLLSPTIVILLIVGLLPFIYVLIVSFYNWNPLGKSDEMTFIAGDNFRKLVFDEDFLLSVWRSIKYAFTTLFFEFIIGFLLALSLRESFPFRPLASARAPPPRQHLKPTSGQSSARSEILAACSVSVQDMFKRSKRC